MKTKHIVLIITLLALVLPFLYSLATKNPMGTNIQSEEKGLEEFKLVWDLSYLKDGEVVRDQNIFGQQIDLIQRAEDFLLLDIFLFNDKHDKKNLVYPENVKTMTDALIAKKKANPDMTIILITDPLNNFYGAYTQKHIKRLEEAGITLVVSDLDKMKDSNPLYSGFYRAYIKWFGVSQEGFIRNFFQKDGPKVSITSILKLINFKGNHRKVYISEKEALISSSNPHDPSGFHSNVAVRFSSPVIIDLIASEIAVMDFSGVEVPALLYKGVDGEPIAGLDLKVMTEKRVYENMKENLEKAGEGDQVWLGIFYISDFKVLRDLRAASDRGAEIKIIADPNKDAFGLEKNGTPNRYSLHELVEKAENVEVRWYDTHGEQYHTKLIYFDFKDRDSVAILGSSNFTKRNLQNLNLETDVLLRMDKGSKTDKDFQSYFERLWNNKEGHYTIGLEEYPADSKILPLIWKIQEKTGLSTW